MNILLWSSNYYPFIGGLERLVHNLALGVMKNGHNVLVVTDASQKSEIIFDEFEGIRVLRLPFTTAIGRQDLPLIKKILQHLDQVFTDFKPDVVNVHGWYETLAFFQARMAEKTSAIFNLTIHGLFEQANYSTQACQRLWTHCQSINTVSKALESSLNEGGHTHSDLRVIQNASRSSNHPVSTVPLPIKDILCIGRLSPEKRFDLAIEAVHRLSYEYSDIHLTIVGGGPLYSDLLMLRNELGLESQVSFADYVKPDQIDRFIDRSSILLVPSDYESFGLVALEAAWRGRPVIASRVMGLCEVIADNETGLLVPPNDPDALARAITLLINSPELSKKLGTAAHQRAKNKFELEDMIKNYEQMYNAGGAFE